MEFVARSAATKAPATSNSRAYEAQRLLKAAPHAAPGSAAAAFKSSSHGPMRDHAVVRDSSVVARLDALADKAQAYRSAEQRFNDKRQASGYQPQGPLSFGEFEVGRSSMPKHCEPSAHFLDQSERGLIYGHMDGFTPIVVGDMGAYDPYNGDAHVYAHATLARTATSTHNHNYSAFGSKSARDFQKPWRGEVMPDPCAYPGAAEAKVKAVYRTTNPVHSVFRSKMLQRPHGQTTTPGPGSHRINHASVEANRPDSGASMRNEFALARSFPDESQHPEFRARSMTGPDVGPDKYNIQGTGTILSSLNKSLERQSRRKPGFGTLAPARPPPFKVSALNAPGPGDYQPAVWTGAPAVPVRRASRTPRAPTTPAPKPKASKPAATPTVQTTAAATPPTAPAVPPVARAPQPVVASTPEVSAKPETASTSAALSVSLDAQLDEADVQA